MSAVNLKTVPIDELRLEIALRTGPRYQCQASDCRAFYDGPGKWDTCPSCGRNGYLCGSFVEDRESQQWQEWEDRTIERYRPNGTPASSASAPSVSADVLLNLTLTQSELKLIFSIFRADCDNGAGENDPAFYSVCNKAKELLRSSITDAAIAAQSKEGGSQ